MIKKITLLSVLLGLSGCSSYYEMKNCDPTKNYINSNPEAMEKYKELVKKGEVRSYYSKITPSSLCEHQKCLKYDTKKYDFQERYFDDNLRHGVYTIKISTDPLDKSCIKKQYSSDKNCYIVTKNNNNLIKSKFSLEININGNITYTKFVDLEENVVLFEASYQIYKTPSIAGEPSGGFCPVKNNHNDYKFNILAYP